MARKGLGRGLKALISAKPNTTDKAPTGTAGGGAVKVSSEVKDGSVIDLPLAHICPSPWQPRTAFDAEKLRNLADSMREQGLIQPLVVRRIGDDKYELIAGERRFRAARSLDWQTAKAVVMEASDLRMRELALVENLQRDDLNPLEIALSYQALQSDAELTHEQIALKLGVSRARITNTLRLLDLPDPVKQMVVNESLRAGHARALLAIPEPHNQIMLAEKIVKEGLSVRAVENIVNGKKTGKKSSVKKSPPVKDKYIADLEDRLRGHLGTRVSIQQQKGKGSIQIEFYSTDDATRILNRMGIADEI